MENPTQTPGYKIDIKRRMAFTRAFALYPQLLQAWTEQNARLLDDKTQTVSRLQLEHEKPVQYSLLARFLCRLMSTRFDRETNFAMATVIRFERYRETTIPIGLTLISTPKRTFSAITAYENQMAEIIFSALHDEAATDPNFDEVGFWVDVFLSFAGNNRRNGPLWNLPAQMVLLNHIADLKAAIKEENEAVHA